MAVASSAHRHLVVLKSPNLNLRALSVFFGRQHRAKVASFSTSPQGKSDHEEVSGTGNSFFYPNSSTLWPDSALGVFAQNDPRFTLPGHTGFGDVSVKRTQPGPKVEPDILTKKTRNEHQAQILYTANDYIHFTQGAEEFLCSGTVSEFPEFQGSKSFEFTLNETPRLLKRELQALFPDRDIMGDNLSVICLSQKTFSDMSTWSYEVEQEREALTEQFIAVAKEIYARLRGENFWCDFIDPSCGKPYFGVNTNTTMFETDEKYRLLGFRIEDLGCCKVICHRDFGRNVFVGTIFTNANVSSGIIQELIADLKIASGENA